MHGRRRAQEQARGFAGRITGATDVVLAFVDPRRAAHRRLNLAYGAMSVVVGVGQVRGSKLLYRTGLTGMLVSLARKLFDDLGSPRSWSWSRWKELRSKNAASTAKKEAPKEQTSAEMRAQLRASIPLPAPGDKLRGARSIATGSISVAMAADRSLPRSQRMVGLAAGALQMVGGVAQLRSSVSLKLSRDSRSSRGVCGSTVRTWSRLRSRCLPNWGSFAR